MKEVKRQICDQMMLKAWEKEEVKFHIAGEVDRQVYWKVGRQIVNLVYFQVKKGLI